MTFSTPILFLIFNRPATTHKVFESLRSLKPAQLFIASDGPRLNRPQDHILVEQSRSIVDLIDWPCEIHKLYRDVNLGCRMAISEALKWFFSSVESGIILEDDILPSTEFFYAMQYLLRFYEDNLDVSSICGRNEIAISTGIKDAPILTDKFWCWGWASWRNRIKHFDSSLPYESSYRFTHRPASIFEKAYINNMISSMRLGFVNTWDYPLDLYFRSKGMKSLLLPFNTVINLGFGSGTHTNHSHTDSSFHQSPLDSSYLTRNAVYDKMYSFKNFLLRKHGSYFAAYKFIILHYFLALSFILKRINSSLRGIS
ncbi:hypothetical protein OAE53_00820 [bacterium]|nr:hypothetical protein [bacterium]